MACQEGKLDLVELLVSSGANLGVQNQVCVLTHILFSYGKVASNTYLCSVPYNKSTKCAF